MVRNIAAKGRLSEIRDRLQHTPLNSHQPYQCGLGSSVDTRVQKTLDIDGSFASLQYADDYRAWLLILLMIGAQYILMAKSTCFTPIQFQNKLR
jgi:hypothetical protein